MTSFLCWLKTSIVTVKVVQWRVVENPVDISSLRSGIIKYAWNTHTYKYIRALRHSREVTARDWVRYHPRRRRRSNFRFLIARGWLPRYWINMGCNHGAGGRGRRRSCLLCMESDFWRWRREGIVKSNSKLGKPMEVWNRVKQSVKGIDGRGWEIYYC